MFLIPSLEKHNPTAYSKYAQQKEDWRGILSATELNVDGISFEGAMSDVVLLADLNGRDFMLMLPKTFVPKEVLAELLRKKHRVCLFRFNGIWPQIQSVKDERRFPYAVADYKLANLSWSNIEDELKNLDALGKRPATFEELLQYFLLKGLPPAGSVVFALGSRLLWGLGPRDPYPFFARSPRVRPVPEKKDENKKGSYSFEEFLLEELTEQIYLGFEGPGQLVAQGKTMMLTVSEKGAS